MPNTGNSNSVVCCFQNAGHKLPRIRSTCEYKILDNIRQSVPAVMKVTSPAGSQVETSISSLSVQHMFTFI